MVSIPNNAIRSRSRALTGASPRIDPRPDAEERKRLSPPRKSGFSSVPAPEVLEKLILQAVSALRRGIYWERGSIINLVV